MKPVFKRIFLHGCWMIGLFHLAKHLMRDKLQILCYHGLEMRDECQFRPKLFISKQAFSKRLKLISKFGFPVLPLSEAIDALQRKVLPKNALAITIDDGFYSVYNVAANMLRSYQYPATVYLTTYYVQKETPIFRLVVQYMFWKAERRRLDLHGCAWSDKQEVDLTNEQMLNRVMWECIDYGEQKCTESKRVEISRELGRLLGVDYQDIKESRIVSLMTENEVRTLAKEGFDIQLHTHRHRFPAEDEAVAIKEVLDNKQSLEAMVDHPLVHFCYPSGIWSERQWPWLAKVGVQTAATCMAGLNDPEVPVLAVRRFLDGANISQIEFAAELFGFMELLRQMRNAIKRIIK